MTGISNIGGPQSFVGIGDQHDHTTQSAASTTRAQQPAHADSALGGRSVGAGSGGLRETLSNVFSGIKDSFTKFLGVGRHADSTTNFMRANPQLVPLMTPREGSPLNSPGILARLEAHASSGGSSATPQQILAFAAAGERIAEALANASPEEARIGKLNVDGVEVSSSVFTTRALMWHMVTQGACLDQERGLPPGDQNSSIVDSGTVVMRDPGNKLFNFLEAAPTSYGRLSSHYRERAEPDASRFLGKPVQKGIEDYQNLMPGHGGSVLFDRIRPSQDAIKAGMPDEPQIFIKLEHVGTPPLMRVTEAHEGLSHKISNAFSSISRFVQHTFSFVNTRNPDNNASEGVVRQEHVYKGRLKETVADPFAAALDRLKQDGVIDETQEKSFTKEIKKHGLPRIEARLEQLLADPRVERSSAHGLLKQVESAIAQSHAALGDDYGIERRGVEVHLSYVPITMGSDGPNDFFHDVPLQ